MKIDDRHLAILSRGRTVGANYYLPDQLDRPDYVAVNKVLEALGGKWNRGQKAHVFPEAAETRIEDAILAGVVTTHREMGFFPTRGEALKTLIFQANILPGHLVLEPNCGTGDVAEAAVVAGGTVVAVELDAKRADLACQVIRAAEIRRGDLTNPQCTVIHADFLDEEPDPRFDRVVMNPPFSVPGNRRADLAHVRHAWKFLRPGGKLAAIMGSGISFREDRASTEFRENVGRLQGRIIPMPEDSFADAGTKVRTVLVTVTKPLELSAYLPL